MIKNITEIFNFFANKTGHNETRNYLHQNFFTDSIILLIIAENAQLLKNQIKLCISRITS